MSARQLAIVAAAIPTLLLLRRYWRQRHAQQASRDLVQLISAVRKPTGYPVIETNGLAPGDCILVTGGTGYTAGFVIKAALEAGYRVRTTVRKIGAAQDYLRRLATAPDALEFVECDLLASQDTWNAAVRGCRAVCHVASPMDFGSEAPLEELVRPVLTSTERILRAAKAAGASRVVVTSSCMTQSCSFPRWAEHVYDENDWADDQASLDKYPYVGRAAACTCANPLGPGGGRSRTPKCCKSAWPSSWATSWAFQCAPSCRVRRASHAQSAHAAHTRRV